jgi:hypothetical protein
MTISHQADERINIVIVIPTSAAHYCRIEMVYSTAGLSPLRNAEPNCVVVTAAITSELFVTSFLFIMSFVS